MTVPSELAARSEKEGVGPDTRPAGTAPEASPGCAAPLALTAVRHAASPLAAVRHVAPPLAAVRHVAPPLAGKASNSARGDILDADAVGAGGGAPPPRFLHATAVRFLRGSGAPAVAAGGTLQPVAVRTPEPTSLLPAPLYEAVIRFLKAQEKWSNIYSASDCIGSRYWEFYQVPDKSISGICPSEFFGPHPVWEGFAVPVRIKKKVNHFYCTFCKKVPYGDATHAHHHIVKGQAKGYQISSDTREFLIRKERNFSERRLGLSSKKNQGTCRAADRAPMDADKLLKDLMKELSRNQDWKFIGASSEELSLIITLLDQSEQLLELGSHPARIAEGFKIASRIALDHKECNPQMFKLSAGNKDCPTQACDTTLPPEIANDCKRALADIYCSQAVEAYASEYPGFEQHAIRSFAYALDDVPLGFAENGNLPPFDMPSEERVTNAVTEHEDAQILIANYQQKVLFATKVVRMILMISLNEDHEVKSEEGEIASKDQEAS
ncbi:hypothetical protein EJB05_41292, partial [Eragrostis curvula]